MKTMASIKDKRLIDLKRSEIAKRAIEAEQAFSDGNVKSGTLDDLWDDLND
jgi:hypothetical protein